MEGWLPAGTEVAYQDELGVLLPYRSHGIARQLVTMRQLSFDAQRLTLNIVRTRKSPPSVTYLWYTAMGTARSDRIRMDA